MDYAIELKNLSKKYQDFELDKITLSIEKGTIMGFVGENGAGKTTTLKAILNLIHVDEGNIKIFGKDHIKYEKELKNNIGVVFDEGSFHDSLNLKDVDKILSKIYETWDSSLFFKYCQKFKLPKNKIIKEYSRGMKMKLSITAALSHHPKLLILDEPTSGLDPMAREEILDLLLDFIQDEEHSVLISSHIIGDLEKIADYITFIHNGKIVFSENKDNLIYNYGIVRCSKSETENLDSLHVIGTRNNRFGCEVLIDNKAEFIKHNHHVLVDTASIEEIITFMGRGFSI
ncbi:MAG: ABC transporter ATP-binding protein [Clostridiales bacterium]|nr:ABC transporter ATP-binding protein [Clostridiales bacterium]